MGNDRLVAVGDILIVSLPEHRPSGHEQEGRRPVVMVAVPQGRLRYPVVIACPITTQRDPWASANRSIYVPLRPCPLGLMKDSVVLIDQIRALDAKRINGYLTSLTEADLDLVRSGLKELFGI